jgi:hypothetical protein
VNVFWNPDSQGFIYPVIAAVTDPTLTFAPPRFFRHTQQELTTAEVKRSRPFAYTKNSLLTKACDRLIVEK